METKMPMGSLMLDLKGLSVGQDEFVKLKHPATGGVILFARNYESPQQVAGLIEEIRSIRGSDILVAVDQEGGRVQRFQDGFTRLPAASRYADGYQPDDPKVLQVAELAGWLMALQL